MTALAALPTVNSLFRYHLLEMRVFAEQIEKSPGKYTKAEIVKRIRSCADSNAAALDRMVAPTKEQSTYIGRVK